MDRAQCPASPLLPGAMSLGATRVAAGRAGASGPATCSDSSLIDSVRLDDATRRPPLPAAAAIRGAQGRSLDRRRLSILSLHCLTPPVVTAGCSVGEPDSGERDRLARVSILYRTSYYLSPAARCGAVTIVLTDCVIFQVRWPHEERRSAVGMQWNPGSL